MFRSRAELFHGIFQPVCHAGGQIAGLPGPVCGGVQLSRQLLHQVHPIGGAVQNGGQLIGEPGEPGGQVINLFHVFIGPVRGGVRQRAGGLPGLPRPVGNSLHPR